MAVLAVHQLYASKYLKELCDIGVLSEISLGRDKLFIHPKLMSLLRGENNEFTPYIIFMKLYDEFRKIKMGSQ